MCYDNNKLLEEGKMFLSKRKGGTNAAWKKEYNLKECTCGKKPFFYKLNGKYTVSCISCGNEAKGSTSKKRAESYWNEDIKNGG
jgi:hypothetical protein